MPVVYHCDNCDVTANSLSGWVMVSIMLIMENPNAPTPPGGRTLESTLPDYVFHTTDCRNEWLVKAGIAQPAQTTTP